MAGRKNQIDNPPVAVVQQVQLATKEPTLAGLAPVGSLFPSQADPPVPPTMADRQRFGLDPLKRGRGRRYLCGGPQQSAEVERETRETSDPRPIRAEARKG